MKLEDTLNDLRFALRALVKSPGFSACAILTLALGIGLVTIQLSFINGALLKGLPVEGSDRIMSVTPLNAKGQPGVPSVEEFVAWRSQQESFAAFGAHTRESVALSGDGVDAHAYRAGVFSAGVLEVLRQQPVLGRGFLPEDEKPNAPAVVLLSHTVWQTQFGGDPAIVGRVVRLRGEVGTIIGVLPPKFAFPQNEELWINLRVGGDPRSGRAGMSDNVEIIGRLRDNAVLAGARAEFDVLMRQTLESARSDSERARTARIWPFTRRSGDSKITVALFSLLGVVGGVLAIACLNVANLLSARALQRSHELALRSALGASRGRLVRQLLTESCLLAMLGAAGGVLLANWGVPLVNRGLALDPSKPFWIEVQLDHRVLLATSGLTLLVGIFAGLFPALRATRDQTNAGLKGVAAGLTSARLGWASRALVIAQIAVSCAVLLAASVMVDAVVRQARVDLPFDAATTLMADIRLPEQTFADHAARLRFQTTLLESVRALPGVKTATLSRGYPLQREGGAAVEIRDLSPATDGVAVVYHLNHAAPGFFRDTRIPLREGRDFNESDNAQNERVAIVNERFARTFWPNESALGKMIRRRSGRGALQEPWFMIVGVTANLPIEPIARNGGMVVHVPLLQSSSSQVTLLVAAAADPRSLVSPVRAAVRALSSDLPMENCQTVLAYFEQRGAPGRLFGLLAFSFGASGLLLAAVGVYGVTTFAVQRRTREFGVRMALGAKPGDVLSLVFRQGLRQMAIGLVCGGGAGWALAQPLRQMMVTLSGPPSITTFSVVFAGVTFALVMALWWPARRAARIEPVSALRSE